MEETFAVIPEDPRAGSPTAYFVRLEVAIDWGLRQYGSGGFRIRKADQALRGKGAHTPEFQGVPR